MSGEIPSLVDLQNTKVRIDHFAELIDGTPSGTSTNPVTGVTHPTYEKAIKDSGFKPASFTFVTGGTLGIADADKCIYNPAPAGDDNWYSWGGTLPHDVDPGTDPTLTGSGYVPRTDVLLRNEIYDSDVKSISLLRQKSPSVDDKLYAVRSYHENLLEGGGLFRYSDDDVTAIDDGVSIILGANGKPMRRINFEHDIRIAGAKCDGVTDDHDAIMRYFNKFSRVDIPAGRHVKSSPLVLTGDDISISIPHGSILEQNSVDGNFISIRPATITEPVSYAGWVAERGRRLRIEGTGRIVANGSGKAIHVRYIENVIIDPVTISGGINCVHLQTCAVINNRSRVEGSAASTCNMLIDTEIDGIGTWAWSESIISSRGGGTGVEVYGFPSVWFDSPVISNCNGIGLYIHTNIAWKVPMTYPVIKSPDIDSTGLAPLQMRNCTNGDVNGGWLSGGRTAGNLRSGAELFYCRDTSLRGVKSQHNGGSGILLDGCTDVSLVDVTGCNNQQNGAYISGCTRTRVMGGNYSNTPERFQPTPQGTGVGVYAGSGNSIHGVTARYNSYKNFDYGGDTTVNDCNGEYNTQQAIAGNWQKPPLKISGNYLWIDAQGYLRGKGSMPTSDLDGVVLSAGHM